MIIIVYLDVFVRYIDNSILTTLYGVTILYCSINCIDTALQILSAAQIVMICGTFYLYALYKSVTLPEITDVC